MNCHSPEFRNFSLWSTNSTSYVQHLSCQIKMSKFEQWISKLSVSPPFTEKQTFCPGFRPSCKERRSLGPSYILPSYHQLHQWGQPSLHPSCLFFFLILLIKYKLHPNYFLTFFFNLFFELFTNFISKNRIRVQPNLFGYFNFLL